MPPFPPQPHLPPSPISFFFTSQILSSPAVAPLPLRCSQVVRWRLRSSEECLALLSSVFVPSDFCTPTTPPQTNHLQTVEPSFFEPAVAFSDWAKAKREIFVACDLSGFLKAHYSLLGSAAAPRGVEQSPLMVTCWVAADLGESSSFFYPFLLFPLPLPLTFLQPFHRVSLCSYFNESFFFSLPLSIFSPSSAASSKTQTTFDKNVRISTFLQNICHTNFIFIRSTENSLRVPCLETICPSISRNPRIVWPNLREAAAMLAFQIPAKVSHNYNCVQQSGLDSSSSSCSNLLVLRKCINLWNPILYVNFHFGKPDCTQPARNGILDIDLYLNLPFKN